MNPKRTEQDMTATTQELLDALKVAHKALEQFRDHPFDAERAAAFARVDEVLQKSAN